MNPEHLSRGWALIAEGAQYLSMAYASDPPAARAGVAGAEGAKESPPPSSVPAPSFDELPPEEWPTTADLRPATDDTPLKPNVEAGLGKCPIHGKPWTVKPAGVSRTGAPYDPFYRCAEKDGDAWCKQKPQKIWRDLHPIPGAAAA